MYTNDQAGFIEGTVLNGVPFTPVHKSALQIPDPDPTEPPMPPSSERSPSAGVIVAEPDGRVWLVEPANHYNGINFTWPKGSVDPGEDPRQTAVREVWEESGLQASIDGVLGDFDKRTTRNRLYLGHRTGGSPCRAGWETQSVRLVTLEEARRLMNRPADLAILDDYENYLAGRPLQNTVQAKAAS